MSCRTFIVGIAIAGWFAGSADAATWHVPDQISTITSALDGAAYGDTIVVAPGTYHETHLIVPSGIVLRGATGDPADVIVDAQQQGDVMMLPQADANTVVEGFTLTGGSAIGFGGGLYCGYPTQATIRHCDIVANLAPSSGGGLACFGAEPVFENCRFIDNYSQDDSVTGGGAVYLNGSDAVFRHCEFRSNSTAGGGGAVSVYASEPTFEHCTFAENQASNGSAVAIYHADASFTDCVVDANRCNGLGVGAIYAYQGTAMLERCTISENQAYWGGGIAGSVDALISLDDCTIARNQGTSAGGGVALFFDSGLNAEDCVWVENSGGDGFVEWDCAAFLTCCETDPELWIGDGVVIFDDEDCVIATRENTWSEVRTMFR